MEGTLSTQRHPDRIRSQGGRAAGHRALVALALWTLAMVTGCQTQPQAVAESAADSPQPVQPSPETVQPVGNPPQDRKSVV